MAANKAKITKRSIASMEPTPGKETILWDTELRGFCVRAYASGRQTYAVRYWKDDRRGWKKIGTIAAMTPDEARRLARQFIASVERGELPEQKENAATDAPRTVADLVQVWLTEGPIDRPNKRQTSWYGEKMCLDAHVVPLIGRVRLAELRSSTIARMQADIVAGKSAKPGKRKSRKVTGGPGAAAHSVRSLSSALGWAVEREWIDRNPALTVKKIQDGTRQRYLSEAEAARLFDTIEELVGEGRVFRTQADCLILLALTGARAGEIKALRWSEVDFDRRLLLLPPSRHKTGGTTIPKTIPLSDPALQLLARRQDLNEVFVFPAESVTGHLNDIRHSWLKIIDRAKLPGFRIHDLRHAYASFAINAGESLQNIGANLGHARTSTTERYAHLLIENRRGVADGVAAAYRHRVTSPEPTQTNVVQFPRRP